MNIPNVEKKLREAEFFLSELADQASRALGVGEEFDCFLSAFLGACRTVDYRLRHEQPTLYPPWRSQWDAALSPDDRALIKFLVDDRNFEIHESGSTRVEGVELIPIYDTYREKGGTVTVTAPIMDGPPASLRKRTYSFQLSGNQIDALDACGKYRTLLKKMVGDFVAAHP